jgi:hypothetical protein
MDLLNNIFIIKVIFTECNINMTARATFFRVFQYPRNLKRISTGANYFSYENILTNYKQSFYLYQTHLTQAKSVSYTYSPLLQNCKGKGRGTP